MNARSTDDIVLDPDRCYAAASSRDARFDGMFIVAVRSTGIYCRPSCPATTPKRRNVTFFRTAAAAQSGGFRACKRCRPDAAPGSPEWNVRGDLVGRAMRMIADGVVDRHGVDGLARGLGYSPRHLTRVLTDELGAGPLAVARAQRAQTARTLIETSALTMTEVAHAAGFGSVRQFNDTIREVYGVNPSDLRARAGSRTPGPIGVVTVRLATRPPFAADQLFAFLAARAIPGLEYVDVGGPVAHYARALSLPHGHGTVDVSPGGVSHLTAEFRLTDWRDLAPAVGRVRCLFDLDADPVAIDTALGGDPSLAPLVAATPGLRVPGSVDPFEALVKAIVGQQVSVAGARTVVGRLVAALGVPLAVAHPHVAATFPTPRAIASADRSVFPMPGARAATLQLAAAAVESGAVTFDAARAAVAEQLLALRGIGPWTANYVIMRGLGDPDVFLPTDLGVRHAIGALGRHPDPERWKPWRSYALHHLWGTLS
jgi:AraC family transcriptional regulator of adaptative response / DNA-3-methyladenine glycosylase II